MRRVLVLGSGGAGKTTFARELAARTGLPLVHLDRLYWRPGWTPSPIEEWEPVVREVTAGEAWVMDGNYGGTLELRLEAADTAVFLDTPRLTCLRRVLARGLRDRGRTRSDMGPGCPERLWPDLEFVRWVWGYPRDVRPRVLARLGEFERRGGRVAILRTPGEAAAFLDTATAAAGPPDPVSIVAMSERRERDGR
jgi:adenylate kinase family enzyme